LLGPNALKDDEGKADLTESEQKDKCFKQFYKVWSAYTKHLKHQVAEKNFSVVCGFFGVFTRYRNLAIPELKESFDK
jgi:hypothetical protein